jgi:hypothetical protein
MFERFPTGLGPVEDFGRKRLDVNPAGSERPAVTGKLDLGGVDEVQVVMTPGIETLAENPIRSNRVVTDSEPVCQFLGQDGFRLVEFEADICDFPGHG